MANDLQKLERGQTVGHSIQLYAGRVMPQTFGEVIEFAKMMAKAGLAVPKHLRDNPGACLSVIQRSMAWEFDPWAIATKTFVVNDVLGYEAQLIAAVVKKWAPITERVIPYKFIGEGAELQCSITLHHAETGEEIPYTSPKKKDIAIQNSPLWKSEPAQQLAYYSIRALARRHFPEILLGVYDRDEVMAMKDITPKIDNFLEDEGPTQIERQTEPERMRPEEFERKIVELQETGEVSASPAEAGSAASIASVGPATNEEANHELEGPDERSDPDTGEILPPEPVSPETIAANMERSIKGAYDRKGVEALQAQWKSDLTALPGALAARVRQAIKDRLKAIETEEL